MSDPEQPRADPLGKRALFWVPPTTAAGPVDPAAPPPAAQGKRALFSTAPATPERDADLPKGAISRDGIFVVTCGTCRAVRRIGLLDLVIYQLPFGYWLPRCWFDRRMTCPACRRRVWASVTLRR